MTVAELIEELKKQPQNLDVFIFKGKKTVNIEVNFCCPELADNYILITEERPNKNLHYHDR
jgi:hypothetical protein